MSKFMLICAAAVATALGIAVPAGVASAAVPAADRPMVAATCSASSCAGEDPVQTGCSADGYPVDGYTWQTPWGLVHLMYSPSCDANWAEVDGASAGVDFAVFNSQNQKQTWYIHSGYTYGWTNMVNGAVPAGASIGTPGDYDCEAQFVANATLCAP